MQESLFSSEAPRVSRSVSRASEKDWMILVATWRSRFFDLLTLHAPSGWYGRTCPEFYQAGQMRRLVKTEPNGSLTILTPSPAAFGNSGMVSPGECSTHSILEFHSGAVACSLSDILETGDVPQRFYLSATACRGILRRAGKRGKELPGGVEFGPSGGRLTEVNPTLDARCKDGPIRNQLAGAVLTSHTLRASGFDASEDGTGRGTPLVPVLPFDTTQITSRANRSNPGYGDPCHPLAAGAHPPALAFSCKDHGADAGELSPTLRSMGHDGSHANGGGQVAVAFGGQMSTPQVDVELSQTLQAKNPQAVATSMAVRRITPLEAERLQGFPDGYTLVPYRGKDAADGPRYRALGNSMAVPVMSYIGSRIQMVEELVGLKREEAA